MAAQSGHQLTWNEDRFGSLEAGKVADMAVLAEDPLTCDLDRLKDIRIERTFLGGRQVFGTRCAAGPWPSAREPEPGPLYKQPRPERDA